LLFPYTKRHHGRVKISASFRLLTFAALPLVFLATVRAQDTTAKPVGPQSSPESSAPATVVRNIVMRPAPKPPEVHPDGSVTFTFIEPNVQDVKLSVDVMPQPMAMTPEAGGVWTYTTKPMKPGIYSYHYILDGEDFADPASTWVTSNLLYHNNMLLVPGSVAGLPPQPWERTNVPHGAVVHRFYHSAVAGDDRDYFVYTPPGYDRRGKKKYPVLYLLHGYSDGADGWTSVGQANFILDNLLAAGKTEPMLVVMTLGYGDPGILHRNRSPFLDPAVIDNNYDKFTKALLTEVMPSVEREYLVKTGPNNTAIAGLSMGGAESLYTGVAHPDKFGYVVALSASHVAYNNPAKELQWKAPRELLWIACGKQDPLVGEVNQKLDEYLKQQGVDVKFNWTEGAHTWVVWRDNLVTFAPLLFRQK
jgi:enterochelin esterase-like enzyme